MYVLEQKRQQAEIKTQEEEDQKAKEEEDAKLTAFTESISSSKDLKENLQEFVDFVNQGSKSTSTYVAQYVHPMKRVGLDGYDDAHITEDPQEIQILHISPSEFDEIVTQKIL